MTEPLIAGVTEQKNNVSANSDCVLPITVIGIIKALY